MGIIDNFKHILTSINFYVPLIIGIVIIFIGSLYQKKLQKYMNSVLFSIGGIDVDFWSISHVVLYIYFGYFFPEYFVEFLIIGALWEVFESTFCKNSLQKIFGCNSTSTNKICNTLSKLTSCDYWYGKLDDIAMNMIGFVIGAWLSTRIR